MAARPIRVFLAEDQTLVREGIKSLLSLSRQVEVVGEAADGGAALALLERASPDVLLLDARMPVLSGIEVLRRLSSESRLPPTIVLTTFDDDALLLEALSAGARGFLLKDVSLDELVRAIRAVAAGESVVSPVVDPRVARNVPSMRAEFPRLDPGPLDGTRTGGPPARRARSEQPGDRARALRGRGNRQEPRLEHSLEARSPRPHAGRSAGDQIRSARVETFESSFRLSTGLSRRAGARRGRVRASPAREGTPRRRDGRRRRVSNATARARARSGRISSRRP